MHKIAVVSVCVLAFIPLSISEGFCAVKACALNSTNEIDRWDCFGSFLFRPPADHGRYVLHPCEGLGWGNGMSSLMIAAQLASAIDGRLLFQRDFTHLWELPMKYNVKHDPFHSNPLLWSYETYGRDEESYRQWIRSIQTNETFLKSFNHQVINSGVCMMDGKLTKLGECVTEALPTFGKCLNRLSFPSDSSPVYYSVFRRPTPLMVRHLRAVRERLALPPLAPGLEPNPGQWGLYTPGYYLFALHFRMIPLGFEPLSVMLNEKEQLDYKLNDLKEFWATARRLAKQARALADCRNETLLIYFATDDVENLRARATKRLGRFGRVVFGLSEDEVGHSSPQWTSMSMRQVDERQAVVLEEKAAAEKARKCTAEAAMTGKCERPARPAGRESKVSVVRTARDAEATEKHRDMALLEWWILANAQVSARNAPQGLTTAAWLASIRVHPHASWPRPGSVTADAHKSIRIASFVTVDEHKHAWFAAVRPCRAANPARLVRETPRAWEPSAAAPSAVSVFRSR